jgi:hypothetical protein
MNMTHSAENPNSWQKIAFLCLLLNGCATAETKATLNMKQLVEMPIEQLMNMTVENSAQLKNKN